MLATCGTLNREPGLELAQLGGKAAELHGNQRIMFSTVRRAYWWVVQACIT